MHEVVEVEGFEEIPVDSIIRAYRRQETALHRVPVIRNDTLSLGRDQGVVTDRILGNSPINPFTLNQDEHLLNVARENNLDDLIKNISDEVISTARERSIDAKFRSKLYRIYEGILRTLIAIIGIASAAMSINGLNNISGSGANIEDTLIFIVGIIIVTVPTLSEFKDRMGFKKRSAKLRKYHNLFEEKIRVIRRIKVSNLDPFEALDQISQIELELNELDSDVFEQGFSNDPKPEQETFSACTAKRKCVVPRQNASIFSQSNGIVDETIDEQVNNESEADREVRLDIIDSDSDV